MKSTVLSLGIIFIALFTLNSCGLGDAKVDAEKTVDVFHKHMKKNQHSAMLKMIDDEGLQATPKEEWLAIFESIESAGKIKSITKNMSFNSEMVNGVTTVELSYSIEFEDMTAEEQFVLRKDGDKFKILGYSIQ